MRQSRNQASAYRFLGYYRFVNGFLAYVFQENRMAGMDARGCLVSHWMACLCCRGDLALHLACDAFVCPSVCSCRSRFSADV